MKHSTLITCVFLIGLFVGVLAGVVVGYDAASRHHIEQMNKFGEGLEQQLRRL